MRRSRFLPVTVAGFSAFVLSLVVIRIGTTASHGGRSVVYEVALGIVFAGITVGSAILAHVCWGRLKDRWPRVSQHVANIVALAAARARKRKAERQKHHIVRQGEAWEYWSSKFRGRYDRFWKRACKEFGTSGSVPPPPTTPPAAAAAATPIAPTPSTTPTTPTTPTSPSPTP